MKRHIGVGLALCPALLAGVAACGSLPGLGGAEADPSASAGSGRVVQLPEDTVYLRGDAAASAGTATGTPARGPIASLSPLPSRTRSTATPSPLPTECTGVYRQGVVNGADVVPAAASAAVSWWNIGDPTLVEYRVAAVSQQLYQGPQPTWIWQSVPAAGGCTRVGTTFTGLSSKVSYVFVVHAVLRKYSSLPPLEPEVARSAATVML